MLAEKKMLSLEEIEAQTALELPSRELPLVTIILTNVLSGNQVFIDVSDVGVAVQVCAEVLNTNPNLTCEIDIN